MLAPQAVSNRCMMLIAGDFCIAALAAYAVFAIVSLSEPVSAIHHNVLCLAVLLGLLCVVANNFQDLYAVEQSFTDGEIVAGLLMASLKLSAVLAIVMLSNHQPLLYRGVYLTYLGLATLLLIVWRLGVKVASTGHVTNEVLILGNGALARQIASEIDSRSHLGYKCLGFVRATSLQRAAGDQPFATGDTTYLAASLGTLARNGHPDSLIVDVDAFEYPAQELLKWRLSGVEVIDCESFYERMTGKLPVNELRESWLLFSPGFLRQRWRLLAKRFVDLVTALILLVFSVPVVVLAAIAIKLDSAGPLFYSQDRVGVNGRVFRILKFRSMLADAEQRSGVIWAAPRDPRITRVGRIIRRLRIDELPQLLNVLRGDMSLVGPRPERPEIIAHLKRMMSLYDYRHGVRPGLTGWAQVCYPYGATVDDAREKLCYDLYYIKNWSLTFDLQILLQTVKVVVYGRGGR
jgi:sugar transferase (PEP-CTERM system associated)